MTNMCHRAKFQQNRSNVFWDIAIFFEAGRRPPSWILKFSNFWSLISLGWWICIAVPNFFKIGQLNGCEDITFNVFFKMAAVRHFDLCGKFWDDPQRQFVGVCYCAKFSWNRISGFDKTKVWIFCAFGQKTPIHAPFGCFWGKIGENGNFLHCYPSRNALTLNWHHTKQTA